MSAQPSAVARQVKIPPSFVCSITGEIMVDPVFAADGHTYEREAIEEWLHTHDTSPKTNLKLKHTELIENHDKRGDILEFLCRHPEVYDEDEVYLPNSWIPQLARAIRTNQIEEVQKWLAKDRRLLTRKLEGDYTAFYLACQFGSPELVTVLLETLTKRNALEKLLGPPAGFKPIHLNRVLETALIEENKPKFSLLRKLGAELNQIEEGGQNTLLHKMAIQGKLDPVKWLLEAGLHIESRNAYGDIPLLLAVREDQVAVARHLLQEKADSEVLDGQGKRPLYLAVERTQRNYKN